MATITTTIREPKTFQQIQDQQNELGKNQTLESLNNNISKLIKAITDRDEKRETEQDRQLKMNQLELSKLQLRRAQLGLAKDEKYYSDYSRKWSEKNNFGTSIGLDKNTSGNIGAIGVSALTAGALNPVIVKNLLFPIMTPLMNVTKALATFPGILPMLFRRASGKSSSAIESDPDRKLHGKLDQILGAIKDKARGNKKEKEEQEGLLSKLLKILVLGAAGLSLVGAALGGEEGLVKNTLIEHGKAMLAGFVLGGWKGALVGLALDVFAKTTGIIPKETDKRTIIDVAADNARQKIEEWANIKISDTEFKLAVAGMMIAGPKGMLAGYILGNEKVQKAIRAFRTDGFEGLKDLADRTILKMAKDTPLEGIPVDVIEGAIAGAAAGSTFGIKGFVSGAILGAAGGFAWDRYKNATIPEASGINTNFDFSKGDFVISGTDKTYSDFLEPLLLEEIKDKDGNTKLKYTRQQAEKLAIERIKQYLEENKIDNKKQTITETIWNTAKENPIETTIMAGGLMTAAYGLLKSATKHTASSISKLIPNTALSPKTISWIKAGLFLAVAGMFQQATDRVNAEYKKRMSTEEGILKSASDNLFDMGIKALTDGRFMDAANSFWQGTFAYATEKSLKFINTAETAAEFKLKTAGVKDLMAGATGTRDLTWWEKTTWKSNKTVRGELAQEALKDTLKHLYNYNSALAPGKKLANAGLLLQLSGLTREDIDFANSKLNNDVNVNEIPRLTSIIQKLLTVPENQQNTVEKLNVTIIDKQKEQEYNNLKQREEQESYQDKERRKKSEEANIEMNEREKENEKKQQPPLVIGDQSSNNEFSGPTSHGSDKYD